MPSNFLKYLSLRELTIIFFGFLLTFLTFIHPSIPLYASCIFFGFFGVKNSFFEEFLAFTFFVISLSLTLDAGPDFEAYYANYVFLSSGTFYQSLEFFEKVEVILPILLKIISLINPNLLIEELLFLFGVIISSFFAYSTIKLSKLFKYETGFFLSNTFLLFSPILISQTTRQGLSLGIIAMLLVTTSIWRRFGLAILSFLTHMSSFLPIVLLVFFRKSWIKIIFLIFISFYASIYFSDILSLISTFSYKAGFYLTDEINDSNLDENTLIFSIVIFLLLCSFLVLSKVFGIRHDGKLGPFTIQIWIFSMAAGFFLLPFDLLTMRLFSFMFLAFMGWAVSIIFLSYGLKQLRFLWILTLSFIIIYIREF